MESSVVRHYRGGKGRSFREIINLMPPHQRYIETHLGGGAVLRNKRPSTTTIGIEIDEQVIADWRSDPLSGVQVIHGDCHHILPHLGIESSDLIYSDPPYVASSRRWPNCYRYDYSVAQHESLLNMLCNAPCSVIISGYRSELYDQKLKGWSRIDYRAQTRGGMVLESAWTNFEPKVPLHDYRYVGRDFREREMLRRKRAGLIRSLVKVDEISLHAALADLAETHPEAILAAAQRISL